MPKGSVLYRTSELPLGHLQSLLLKAITLLQAFSSAPLQVKLVEDWLDHDGLEFPKGVQPLAYLFSIASTPRSLFENTPKDTGVYLRAEAEGEAWILRVRSDWDEEDRNQVGDFQLVIRSEYGPRVEVAFEKEISGGILIKDDNRG